MSTFTSLPEGNHYEPLQTTIKHNESLITNHLFITNYWPFITIWFTASTVPHGRYGYATLVRLADQRADFEVAVEQMRLKMEREQERRGGRAEESTLFEDGDGDFPSFSH